MSVRYDEPHAAAKAANTLIRWLAEVGISIAGTRALRVRGRKTGRLRGVVINVLTVADLDYLVSPRGHTQWVRNLRVSGEGRLRLGGRTQPFTAVELADDQKSALLRAYLRKWKMEVGVFFAGVGPDSSDDELRRIAPDHPIFKLTLT